MHWGKERKGEEIDKGSGHTSWSGLLMEESPDGSLGCLRDGVHSWGWSGGREKEGGTSPSPPAKRLATRGAMAALTGDGKSANMRSRTSLQSSDETRAISIKVCARCAPGRMLWDCCISWAFWDWLLWLFTGGSSQGVLSSVCIIRWSWMIYSARGPVFTFLSIDWCSLLTTRLWMVRWMDGSLLIFVTISFRLMLDHRTLLLLVTRTYLVLIVHS